MSYEQWALEFDGEDDYVDIGSDSVFDMTNEITIEAWFLQRELKSSFHMILHKSPTNQAWLVVNSQGSGSAGDEISFRWYDGEDSHHEVTATGLNENEWYHMAAVHDGSEGKIYIDGNLIDSKEAGFAPVTGDILEIGAQGSNDRFFWNGKIEEVRIWDKALTQEEINHYKDNPPSGDEEGLVGYWPMNEGFGVDTVLDYSGNNNHGKIEGASWHSLGYDYNSWVKKNGVWKPITGLHVKKN